MNAEVPRCQPRGSLPTARALVHGVPGSALSGYHVNQTPLGLPPFEGHLPAILTRRSQIRPNGKKRIS